MRAIGLICSLASQGRAVQAVRQPAGDRETVQVPDLRLAGEVSGDDQSDLNMISNIS